MAKSRLTKHFKSGYCIIYNSIPLKIFDARIMVIIREGNLLLLLFQMINSTNTTLRPDSGYMGSVIVPFALVTVLVNIFFFTLGMKALKKNAHNMFVISMCGGDCLYGVSLFMLSITNKISGAFSGLCFSQIVIYLISMNTTLTVALLICVERFATIKLSNSCTLIRTEKKKKLMGIIALAVTTGYLIMSILIVPRRIDGANICYLEIFYIHYNYRFVMSLLSSLFVCLISMIIFIYGIIVYMLFKFIHTKTKIHSKLQIPLESTNINKVESTNINKGESINVNKMEPMNITKVKPINITKVEPMNITKVEPMNINNVESTNINKVESTNINKVESMNINKVESTRENNTNKVVIAWMDNRNRVDPHKKMDLHNRLDNNSRINNRNPAMHDVLEDITGSLDASGGQSVIEMNSAISVSGVYMDIKGSSLCSSHKHDNNHKETAIARVNNKTGTCTIERQSFDTMVKMKRPPRKEYQNPSAVKMWELRALATSCYIIGSTILLHGPVTVCLILSAFGVSFPRAIGDVLALLLALNCVINPFIYAFRFKELRRAIKGIFCCRKKVAIQKSVIDSREEKEKDDCA